MTHQHDDPERDELDHDDPEHEHEEGGGEGPAVTAIVEDLGPCKKLLKVEIPSEEVQREISSRLERLRRSVTLKGFRKGKAPQQRIEQLYGSAVREDARKQLLHQSYTRALEEKLGQEKILGEGTIDNVAFSPDGGLKYEVTLHTRPTFQLGDYKGVEVVLPPLEVDEKDLQTAIDRFRRSRGEMRPVEGEGAVVEAEDLLSVDVQVWLADEHETWAQAQESQESAQACDLKPLKEEFGLDVRLPSGSLGSYAVEDLADSLQGLGIGAWGEAETDLPPDYEVVEGRGEPAVLRIRVVAIKRLFLPELTEEWAKEAGHASIADLKRELREELQQRLEVLRRQEVELRVLDHLLRQVGAFELPLDIIDKEVQNAERRRALELRLQGKGEEEAKESIEQERESIRREVERMLRQFFILDEVARREDIAATDRDVEARIARLAAAGGKRPQQVREELEKHDMMGQLRHEVLDEKVRALLRQHAKVVEKAPAD